MASPILAESLPNKDLKEQIKKLQVVLLTIQDWFRIADHQPPDMLHPRLFDWLRDVLYEADDLFDELTAAALQRQMKINKVRILTLKPFGNYVTYLKIRDVRQRLDKLAGKIPDVNLRRSTVIHGRYLTAERGQTRNHLVESRVYGRENDVERIVEMLVLSSRSEVIPIVGKSGIGKTTLAQLAYNDPRVNQHFDSKVWISVCDYFDVKKLMNEIWDYTTEGNSGNEHSQLGVLQIRLCGSLSGKRYLIVLDDVWGGSEAEWDKLRIPLRCGADGSKMLVTTRNESVASIMGTVQPYLVEPLTIDDLLTLFKQHRFAEDKQLIHQRTFAEDKQLVDECCGVPLAAKICGGIMCYLGEERVFSDFPTVMPRAYYRHYTDFWDAYGRTVLARMGYARGIVDSMDMDDRILAQRLWWIHHKLPSHLRRCFTHLSVFPRNYEINKEKLIHQWIAEGLVHSPGDTISSKKMEDTANEYFYDLMSMSLFQGVTKCADDDGVITQFKLHDLIYEFALFVAGVEVFRLNDYSADIYLAIRAHHLSLLYRFLTVENIKALLSSKMKFHTVNLFPLRSGVDVEHVITQRTSYQRRLRVLNCSGCHIEKLHESIGGLIQLRSLDLSNTPVNTIPESICHLFNLQTLDMSGCNGLKELPSGISNLINLRHLNIKDCTRLSHMPGNIRKLTNLQTLPIFIVGQSLEESLFQIVHLDLRGELEIKCLENVRNMLPDLCLAYKKLQSLGLSWGNANEGKSNIDVSRQTAERNHGQNAENVLACLQPNSNLRRLSIREYSGAAFPPWMNHAMLPNLTKLELINCRRCENLPLLGQLPLLKVLNMKGMGGVAKIGHEFYGRNGRQQPFQSLSELTITDFPELRTWEGMDGAEAFPCLNRLTITKCPRFSSMPRFPSLQHLELHECNAMILSSAADLNSLSTLVVDIFPELHLLPAKLLQNNSLLTSLTVSSCPTLASLPANFGSLTALKSLSIRGCEELESLPQGLSNLSSLQTLEISECSRLISLPEEGIEGLKSLRSFSVENCYNLASLPMKMKHLKALEHLKIMHCPRLPDGLEHVPAFRNLFIVRCTEIVSLPEGLQHAKMLQNLEICSCPGLMELPEWVENLVSLRSLAISDCQNIKSFPKGLQRLMGLQALSIRDCPDLEKRCQKETGEDWHKISHIPYIYVGLPELQQGQDGPDGTSS